jgi:2-amino-4-hydroxy-6-hydroxymethyldihydropteridine diphosphokinase
MTTTAYIGLGANLDDPVAQIEYAFDELARLPQTQFVARSSLYASAPVGYLDQPDFINAVAEVATTLSAHALLAALLAIEQRHGRDRSFRNAPRTLDLDLLLFGETQLHDAQLTLPHPRMHQRAFVLLPLSELAPELGISGLALVADLLAHCSDQQVALLTPPRFAMTGS